MFCHITVKQTRYAREGTLGANGRPIPAAAESLEPDFSEKLSSKTPLETGFRDGNYGFRGEPERKKDILPEPEIFGDFRT